MTAFSFRDHSGEPYRLSKTRLSELCNEGARSKVYRFVYLRDLKKAINNRTVYGEVRCHNLFEFGIDSTTDYSVHVDSSSKILSIGCKKFHGSAYSKIMRAARAA